MIANILTLSRIPFSVLLFVFSPSSLPFAVFYVLCGITDILDGYCARRLHTESETGAMLDSIADLVFALSYAVRILPLLSVPFWIWLWAAVIALIKTAGIIIAGKQAHGLMIEHSIGNKLTGVLLFLLPFSVYITDVKYIAALVCVAATVTAVSEIIKIYRGNKNVV